MDRLTVEDCLKPTDIHAFDALVRSVTEGFQESVANGYESEEFKQHVFEAAMTAVYGSEYWEWSRKQRW